MKKTLALILAASIGCSTYSSSSGVQDTWRPRPDELVVYEPKVMNDFFNIFGGQGREIYVCLSGENNPEQIIVKDTYMPHIKMLDNGNYIASCPTEDYLGLAHNHPNGRCGLNQSDINRFQRDSLAVIETIICVVVPEERSVMYTLAVKNER